MEAFRNSKSISLLQTLKWNPMKNEIVASLLFIIISTAIVAQNQSDYKGKVFYLKTSIAAFGSSRVSAWDSRQIYDGIVRTRSMDGKIQINGDTEWPNQYFCSAQPFEVKEFDIKKKDEIVLMKMQNVYNGTELKLNLPLDDLEKHLSAIFSKERDLDQYSLEAKVRIIKSQIVPKIGEGKYNDEILMKLVDDLYELGGKISGRADFEIRKDGYYVRMVVPNGTVFNTIQMDKNKMLSTTAESFLRIVKQAIGKYEHKSGLISGYIVAWPIYYKNFLRKYDNPSISSAEFISSRGDFDEYSKGELSAQELVLRGILKVDGEKYLLRDWDPAQIN